MSDKERLEFLEKFFDLYYWAITEGGFEMTKKRIK